MDNKIVRLMAGEAREMTANSDRLSFEKNVGTFWAMVHNAIENSVYSISIEMPEYYQFLKEEFEPLGYKVTRIMPFYGGPEKVVISWGKES